MELKNLKSFDTFLNESIEEKISVEEKSFVKWANNMVSSYLGKNANMREIDKLIKEIDSMNLDKGGKMSKFLIRIFNRQYTNESFILDEDLKFPDLYDEKGYGDEFSSNPFSDKAEIEFQKIGAKNIKIVGSGKGYKVSFTLKGRKHDVEYYTNGKLVESTKYEISEASGRYDDFLDQLYKLRDSIMNTKAKSLLIKREFKGFGGDYNTLKTDLDTMSDSIKDIIKRLEKFQIIKWD